MASCHSRTSASNSSKLIGSAGGVLSVLFLVLICVFVLFIALSPGVF